MKKLPARTEGLMGVVEIDKAGKGWLAPVDKRVRRAAPIADLGEARAGELVLAERVGKSERSGVKVVEVIGDPLAPGSFSLIAIAKYGIEDKVGYISTGGGAFLEVLEGKTLPAFEILSKRAAG